MKMGFTDIDSARTRVTDVLDSLSSKEAQKLRIPKTLLDEISGNFTKTPCKFEPETYSADPDFKWHPCSVGKDCLDGPKVAPDNHKILAESAHMRLLNVYAPVSACSSKCLRSRPLAKLMTPEDSLERRSRIHPLRFRVSPPHKALEVFLN